MKLSSMDFLGSAVGPKQFPEANKPEIAFAGRSNVGKSSLLNLLLNRRNFARTSQTPGKTQMINFYEINKEFRFVDLPGYGYAKVSKEKQANWGDFIDQYLYDRDNLLEILLLVDSRHKPTQEDVGMYAYIKDRGYSGIVVMTKVDKLKNSERKKQRQLIAKTLGADSKLIFETSASSREGKYPFWDFLNKTFQDAGYDINVERQMG